jgi:predicted nucleotidyltransferase
MLHNKMGLLEELFSSRTRAQVIGLLTSRPGERLYLREIARLIRCDVRAVKQEIDRLERLGFLASESSGNRRYLQVNEDFPLYPELKSMVLKTLGLGEALASGLTELAGIQFAFVYGSVAKGGESATSDLDLFVVGEVSGPLLHKALSQAKAALHREINTSRFALKELKERLRKGDAFLKDVAKNPKIFLIGNESDFRRAAGLRPA